MIFLKCGYARLRQEENSNIQTLISDKIYLFLLKVYQPLAGLPAVSLEGLPASGVVYPPSFLSAGCVAEWRGVLGKTGCWERNANQSLSVTPVEPFISWLKGR